MFFSNYTYIACQGTKQVANLCSLNCFPGKQDVSCPNNSIKRGLSGSVTIVKKMFCISIVYCKNRYLKGAVPFHCLQPYHTRCRFFHTPQYLRYQFFPFLMNS